MIRTTDPAGHGSWEVNEIVRTGDLVFVEFSACVLGHHSPLMRTCYVARGATASGGEDRRPRGEENHYVVVEEAEKLINEVFEVCLPLMKPGAVAAEIDKIGRGIMESNKFGGLMSARLAYTAGGTAANPCGNAGWGDADFSLVAHNSGVLKAGMTMHFIPWFQVYGTGGGLKGPIGLSDVVVVTQEGGKRVGVMPLKITVVEGGEKANPETGKDSSCAVPAAGTSVVVQEKRGSSCVA